MSDTGYFSRTHGRAVLYDIRVYTQFLDACHFPYVVDMGGLLSSGIFEGGGVADRINEFSAMNCIAFIVLGIPMLVMLRKSRRIRLEMLYNNVTIIDDEREGAKLAVVSLVLGICSIIFSFLAI